MRRISVILVVLAVVLAIAAGCRLPGGDAGPQGEAAAAPEPTVENDAAREQAVYVSAAGARVDIISEEQGQTVRCVEATDIVVLSGDSAARSAHARRTRVIALVIGRRNDGSPGVWEIHSDDTVHAVGSPETGDASSTLPESGDINGQMRGFFGWTYEALDAAEGPDGDVLIVGLARNEYGFRFWLWAIEPGTTVGVYWRLSPQPEGCYRIQHFSRVIGEPPEESADSESRSDSTESYSWFWRRLLSGLRLFFLDWYGSYLIDVDRDDTKSGSDNVIYDASETAYVVDGTDDFGEKAIAYIGTDGSIRIESGPPVEPPVEPVIYERLWIETFQADPLAAPADTAIALYSESDRKKPIATSDEADYDDLDYTGGLESGIYYIKITQGKFTRTPDQYGIRVLTPAPGQLITRPSGFGMGSANVADAPYEPDDTDPWSGGTPAEISIDETGLNRYLTKNDVDWLMLVLE